MIRLLSRIESMVIAALVGWWSPLLGLLVLYAIGHYLGWWVVGAMLVAAAIDVARWPGPWRVR